MFVIRKPISARRAASSVTTPNGLRVKDLPMHCRGTRTQLHAISRAVITMSVARSSKHWVTKRFHALTAFAALAASMVVSTLAVAADARDTTAASPIASSQSAGAAEQLARALAYEHGEGMPKDQRLAAALYCEAAVKGSAEAAFRLGWMYANGRGV